MLTTRPKTNELTFRVYSKSLHPELLCTHASRMVEREKYSLDCRITTSGHLLTLLVGDQRLSEVVTSAHRELPVHQKLLGKTVGRTFCERLAINGVASYETTVQLQAVDSSNLNFINRIIQESEPTQALVYQFGSNGRIQLGALSFINIESRIDRVLVQAIHTFPDANRLLTTETVFRIG